MMQIATDEYSLALKKGQREYKELAAAGQRTHPLVLDEILPAVFTDSSIESRVTHSEAYFIALQTCSSVSKISINLILSLRNCSTATSLAECNTADAAPPRLSDLRASLSGMNVSRSGSAKVIVPIFARFNLGITASNL